MIRKALLIICLAASSVAIAQTGENGKCVWGNCIGPSNGKMVFPETSRYIEYEGTFNEGVFSGLGKLKLRNGDYYEGSFLNGKFWGFGKLKYANGDLYDGEFRDGLRQGGTLTTKEAKYEAYFRNDVMEGSCVITYTDGRKERGKFRNSVFIPENQENKNSTNSASVANSSNGTNSNGTQQNKRSYTAQAAGAKEWMTENLSVTHFNNGDPIPQAKSLADLQNAQPLSKPMWCYYNFDPSTEAKYGKLYNYFAVQDPRGILPEGYVLPSLKDFHTINSFANFQATNGYASVYKPIKLYKDRDKPSLDYNMDFIAGPKATPGFEDITKCGCYWSSDVHYSDGRYLISAFIIYPSSNQAEDKLYEHSYLLSVRGVRGAQNSYAGNWNNGQRNGKGVEKFEVTTQIKGYGSVYPGDRYEGNWVNGRKEGDGSIITKNGTVTNGLWKNNEFVGPWEYVDNRHKCYECKAKLTKSVKKTDAQLAEVKSKANFTKIDLYQADGYCSTECERKSNKEFWQAWNKAEDDSRKSEAEKQAQIVWLYQKPEGKISYIVIGKFDGGKVYQKPEGKISYIEVGKVEGTKIYYKETGKITYTEVGKFEGNKIFRKKPGRIDFEEIGKFEGSKLYYKRPGRIDYIEVGKFDGVGASSAAACALLILF